MIVVGINAYHGDVSAVILRDGELIVAVEEERFRRIKHVAGFPRHSIAACLEMAGVAPREIDCFAISRNPRANMVRKVAFALTARPSASMVRDRLRHRRVVSDVAGTLAEMLGLERGAVSRRLRWVEHHPAHLASAFFMSPFEDAAVCAIDGFGDFVSTSSCLGHRARLEPLRKVYFPHSLGLLYLAMTQYLGFPKYGDEYKVMGLAPYGEPRYVHEIRKLIQLLPDGRFQLDLTYFRHWSEGAPMTWDDGEPTLGPVFTPKLEALLGPARQPGDPLEPRHEAIAASIQQVFEEAAFHVLHALYRRVRVPRLCLAGGCAMNSVANGKVRGRTPFEELYVQPAAGDNGTALGAALYVWHQVLGRPRQFVMEHAYWGPASGDADIRAALEADRDRLVALGAIPRVVEDEGELCAWTAAQLERGRVVGWFQGRMEWGARSLGNRSILADPRRGDMRDIINTKIKFRERFRPFAPSILEEALDEYFVDAVPDPFMIQVYAVRPAKRSVIPAVTHVDGSGRLQTVNRSANPRYWRLLRAFADLTGVPVLLNTSFNESEPIVRQPSEALDCFLRTQMDVLVIENFIVEKTHAGPVSPVLAVQHPGRS